MASSDRVAIITGGANGIGKACARRLSEDGCQVVIADVNAEAGQDLADELGADKGKALFVQCDVSDRLAVNNLLSETRASFDRLDILVNNAGIVAGGDILSLTEADFDRVMGVNLKGAFLVARGAPRHSKCGTLAHLIRRAHAHHRCHLADWHLQLGGQARAQVSSIASAERAHGACS